MNNFPEPLDPESEAAYVYEHPEWDEGDGMTDEQIEEWTEEDQLRDDMEFMDREAHAVDALIRGESEEEVERKWPSDRV